MFLNRENQRQVTALTRVDSKQVIKFGKVKIGVELTVSGIHIDV